MKAGDVIAVKDRDCEKIKECIEKNSARPLVSWMESGDMAVTVKNLPERSEIDFNVEEHLIVELYSK